MCNDFELLLFTYSHRQSLKARVKLSNGTGLVCQEEGQQKQTLVIYSLTTSQFSCTYLHLWSLQVSQEIVLPASVALWSSL